MNVVKCWNDEMMMMRICGEDLVVMEVKYYRGCYWRYIVVVLLFKFNGSDNNI